MNADPTRNLPQELKATDLLIQEHEKIRDFFEKLSSEDTPAKELLFEEVKFMLRDHAQLEERLFYPAVRVISEKAAELVDGAVDEHRDVDDLLEELDTLADDEEAFEETIQELQDSVADHVEEEESKIFAEAEKLGAGELLRLGREMAALRQELLEKRNRMDADQPGDLAGTGIHI